MDDQGLHDRIETLIEEEQALLRSHAGEGLSDEEHARREALEVQLDRLWDLLRQRRARREAGFDPDEARIRDAETVEDYEQ
ncbi:DUF2630 family protein [Patulibacter defluvii]|uniref:DUF2630 family protein n=1 Tax=Patulibacter defluvii TaxID=3095358 RepID=UPI002A7517FA|nr:DUF2630 family protein [Patulibacter sp. DM4]